MKTIDRKNVLVTGGAGFIGSHLCEALLKEANVICMDNFSTSTVENIKPFLQNPQFEFINHDITQPFQLSDFSELERFHVSIQGVQEIYHLACPISKAHFDDFKIATILTNSIGTKQVLDIAVASRAKILFASSSVLYGPRLASHAYAAESDPAYMDHLTSSGAYDEGKRFSESIFYTYRDIYKLDVKIARLFRTYGPRMKIFDGHLIPDLVNLALDDQDLVLSDPDARLSLCFISDIVDGLCEQMNAPSDVTVINLGSDQETTLRRVAELIVRLADSSSRIRFESGGAGLPEAPLPDISRARQFLHWLPLVRLEDGLARMIEDARSRKNQLKSFSSTYAN
ncbi:MAG TPA: NAD-dependent epimerase/dehydratase family protein [Patescibacteria group bacterium]|nr:NAD-dependent epimerase/dehydratase family protein [Patescibacteria group bacterium]